MRSKRRFWGVAPIAKVILGFSLAMSLFFGIRIVSHWSDPTHQEQSIAAWMTPGYIGQSWDVPKEVVIEALGAPDPPPDGVRNLVDLARYLGVTVEELIIRAEQGIAAFEASDPATGGQELP